MIKSTRLDPIISEFATQEDADAYDAWNRKKVQDALDDLRPDIPDEQVRQETSDLLRGISARRKRA